MKKCDECEYFDGYDPDNGTPNCMIDGGYERCLYNDETPSEEVKDKTQIIIDAEYMTKYIRETLKNTFEKEANYIAEREIKRIVNDKYQSIVESLTEDAVAEIVQKQVEEYMAGDIQVGGGWREPVRTVSRNQYLTEVVEQTLKDKAEKDNLVGYAKSAASKVIDDFTCKMKNEINLGIKKKFDETTRQTLTDNIVAMLMMSETYQGLANAAQKLLP